ncbi:NAD(P)H-binding domain-containing protein [Hirsutella rhossiliensis]|uniref:NAD(P)H-binding domain-containing protein n=1 Tax=Hirsutella rhossiliensis TaxID=111463 RepID=A0A9P8SET7_9HYPO|nr:NAD(P)H-binding domain-containing protein [Hirsutella rhossiliensis]KAH0958715.1 NAD(P)H-binding domain-containing protein [Hirsutella rhossiliensis]
MSAPIQTVAVAGAAGSLGSVLVARLVASGRFKVRVLRRQGSGSTFAPGTDVVDVDFGSVDSLSAALAGQDAVVAALGAPGLGLQPTLVDAAVAAGVRRFLPSEFGSDLANPLTRKLPVFADKARTSDYLEAKASTTLLTYTLVSNGPFLDWGLRHNFILDSSSYKPAIWDGGDAVFSTTTLASVADAVVGVLSHPDETRNRTVYVEDLKLTQNRLLALAKEAAPDKPWEAQPASLDAATQRADQRLAQGLYDMETFAPYLFRAILDPAYGGAYHQTDNELLGVKGKTEQDVVHLLKQILSER